MNELNNEIINKIVEYLNYIETKEMELINIENKKNKIAETMNDNN